MHTFNLIRYFSLLTFALILIAGLVLGEVVRRQQIDGLKQMAEDRNVAMTKIFRNALWQHFAPLAEKALTGTASGAHLRAAAEHEGLRTQVVALMQESETVKIKVYAPNGLTVFSTDERQIGEDKSGNPGLIAATNGRIASELTHRNQIDSFEGSLEDRNVMASYVPVFENGKVVGVVESYQDVTRFVHEIDRQQYRLWGMILLALGALYLMQLLVVRHAQRLIKTQELALEEANRELDQRVIARTLELDNTNKRLEQEIAEHRRTQGELDYLFYYDALTTLPNRTLLLNRLKKAIAANADSGQLGALLLVDLDHFRAINDTEGRTRGDQFLREVADRLQTCVRDSDTVCRLGNDQFLIMLESLGKARADAANRAETTGEKIQTRLQHPHEGEGTGIGCSVGIALFGGKTNDPDNLLKQAELAMCDAKAAGGASLRFFDPDMQAAASARAVLEKDLREALQTGQFQLHYQPQVDAHKMIQGAEALIRWQHPQRGLVSPIEFISFAEESGLILPLGRWILTSACEQLAAWARQPALAAITLAVNISPRQFRDAYFVDEVLAILKHTGAPPERLKLEITESLLLDDLDDIVAKMHELRGRGIGFSLDDFGTGYSSLSYLTRLPLDQIKIDKSFVMDLETHDHSAVLCASIISLAHNLKLKIVAEGVETESQSYFLTTVHHCDLMQGYHFSRPVSLEAFEQLVQGR
jgi:diguanylate cyclase (GGDEF)-like protein